MVTSGSVDSPPTPPCGAISGAESPLVVGGSAAVVCIASAGVVASGAAAACVVELFDLVSIVVDCRDANDVWAPVDRGRIASLSLAAALATPAVTAAAVDPFCLLTTGVLGNDGGFGGNQKLSTLASPLPTNSLASAPVSTSGNGR